ncbi:hypothetical protein EDD17DRAFT_936144 [Pisolithus thermaeus]|nr:hypothetical protein EDD17DRAFT_936144 [Pisolithus thermaeus]
MQWVPVTRTHDTDIRHSCSSTHKHPSPFSGGWRGVSVPLTMLTKPSHHDSHWAYTTLFGCVWSCIGCSHIYATSLPVRDISFFSPFSYVLSLYHLAVHTRNHTRRSTFFRVPF